MACESFPSRKNMIGSAVVQEDGFAGLVDMGSFYLVQNDDGTGSKSEVAWHLKKFDTLGWDLLAMVLDDAICVGAEMITVSNTVDIARVDKEVITPLMRGLKDAALHARVIIPGGEIAELPGQVEHFVWNATGVGIVHKDKVITGNNIRSGDAIIGLRSKGLRSNGYSLARYVLEKNFGEHWFMEAFNDTTWGELLLTPSRLYAPYIHEIIGRFEEPKSHNIKGLVHVTGGGIANNIHRILKGASLGAKIDSPLIPYPFMHELQRIGEVEDKEAYSTWNMGQGMLIITDNPEDILKQLPEDLEARHIGTVKEGTDINLTSKGYHSDGEILNFSF